MLKFIVDTQLPPKLSTWISKRGHDAVHTFDFEKGALLDDKEIVIIAIEQSRIIVTKDSDFFDHFLLKGSPPKVLLLEIGNCSNKKLTKIFEKHFNLFVELFDIQNSSLVIQDLTNTISY